MLPVPQNALNRALEIFKSRRNSKIIIEAMLFVDEPVTQLVDKIARHMNINRAVPQLYAEYFFNPLAFQDMFDKLDYLEALGSHTSPWMVKDKITKQLALTDGFSSVLLHFKGGAYDYTPQEYTRRLLGIACRMVAEAQNSGINSTQADKLYKWIQLASSLSLTLKSLTADSGEDVLADIRMALEFDRPPVSIDTIDPVNLIRG